MSKGRDLLLITFLYSLLTLLMTWPLAAGLASDVPADLGDSLLNLWILGWGAEHFPRLDPNANIFHPEPLALAFSEHLFGQVVQILPVYYTTGNLILCYNLLFLSTFVLSGVGMYLLVRDITGSKPAAFVAGLMYAFVPFRAAQLPHIQTVSSQWMPFALYGFRRYIVSSGTGTGRPLLWLALGSAALLMQHWSCGYYMIFFAPFVAIFVVHQIVTAGRGRDWKAWAAFAVAALVVAAGSWPFLSMYLEAQRVHTMQRPFGEVLTYSADVYGYVTAAEYLKLWGPILRFAPKSEGEVFLGFLPVALALFAFGRNGGGGERAAADRRALSFRTVATWLLAVVALTMLAGVAAIVLTGGFVTSIGGVPVRATNLGRSFWQLAVVLVLLMLASPGARATARRMLASPAGLAAACLLLAMWLSLGPMPQTRGLPIPGAGLYGFFYDYVPGFSGLRVPARYAMVAAVYLALLAGIGAAWLMRRASRPLLLAAVFSAVFLVEAWFAPMPVNLTWGGESVTPPARVETPARAPAVYRHLATMPAEVVVAEFPFGDPAWELRYVYYSTVHWKRLLNGYSGGFPDGYRQRAARLQHIELAPVEAWRTLIDAGATHVVVHEAAQSPRETQIVEAWLDEHQARPIGRFDADVLYALPRSTP